MVRGAAGITPNWIAGDMLHKPFSFFLHGLVRTFLVSVRMRYELEVLGMCEKQVVGMLVQQ